METLETIAKIVTILLVIAFFLYLAARSINAKNQQEDRNERLHEDATKTVSNRHLSPKP